jgi:hypothetical protein
MKEKVNARKDVAGRDRCQHSRIRNNHLGRSWLRRIVANDFAQSRSASDANGTNQICFECFGNNLGEKGSVTAEFAIVLPGVMLILFFSLSVLALQASRIGLVELAAQGSRALARGESEELVTQLLRESQVGESASFRVRYRELSICVEVVQTAEINGLGGVFPIELSETQCTRKGGL